VAPFSFLGLAAPERRRRAGLLGVSKARGVTSPGDSAVFEGLRVPATVRTGAASATGTDLAPVLLTALTVSSLARLVAGIQKLLFYSSKTARQFNGMALNIQEI
jgi:hypothetical protein